MKNDECPLAIVTMQSFSKLPEWENNPRFFFPIAGLESPTISQSLSIEQIGETFSSEFNAIPATAPIFDTFRSSVDINWQEQLQAISVTTMVLPSYGRTICPLPSEKKEELSSTPKIAKMPIRHAKRPFTDWMP